MRFKQIGLLFFILNVVFISCGGTNSFTPAPSPALDTTIIKNGKFKVSKHFDGKSKTWYYLTRIYNKDKSGELLKLRYAIADKHKSEEGGAIASEFASKTGALLVFNGALSTIVSTSSGKMLKPLGIRIVDGKILLNELTKRYTLGIKDNNELVVYPPGVTAKEIVEDNTNTALTGFVPLIEDHQPVSDDVIATVKNLGVKNPRQVIAQFDNLDIVFLTCGGRGHGGTGMTANDLIRILGKLDVKFAYNLDGGGSSSTVIDGKFINWKMDDHGTKERPRLSFLYVEK
jgi:exopolysaccharide biosynthesis protein